MDVPREGAAKKRLIKRIVIGVVVLLAGGAVSAALSRLQPAAPGVEWSTIWPGTVKRGPMIRNVRGLGTLVPEDILFVPSVTEGRVERKLLLPGTTVKADTVILVLTNPELQLAAFDMEWQVKAAEANMRDLRVQLASKKLTQEADTARVDSDLVQAKLTADRDEALVKLGLTADLQFKLSKAKADELTNRLKIEQKRLAINEDAISAQLAAQQVNIEKLKAAFDLKKQQVEQLKIRAGTDGVLQTVEVEVGQRVAPGALLAKVVQPWKLKAQLKIAETQMKDLVAGLPAQIDTRNGLIEGVVSRIDPAAVNGTVTVDVKLGGPLPQGARPDLSVDGTVDLERIKDVMFVERPVFGQPNSTVSLFKIGADGKEATRQQVKFGRGSVSTIEVLEGLKVGDQVVLSDMSQWDAHNRIKFNR